MKRHKNRRERKDATWRQRQRLELCFYKSRNNTESQEHQEGRERHGTDSVLVASESTALQHLDFGLSASRTVRESTSAKTHPIYGTLSWNPQEVNTPYYELCKWNNITSTIFWLLYSMQWEFPFCPWRLNAVELPSYHKTIRKLRNKNYEINNVSLTIVLDHCLERISVLGGHREPNNLSSGDWDWSFGRPASLNCRAGYQKRGSYTERASSKDMHRGLL